MGGCRNSIDGPSCELRSGAAISQSNAPWDLGSEKGNLNLSLRLCVQLFCPDDKFHVHEDFHVGHGRGKCEECGRNWMEEPPMPMPPPPPRPLRALLVEDNAMNAKVGPCLGSMDWFRYVLGIIRQANTHWEMNTPLHWILLIDPV